MLGRFLGRILANGLGLWIAARLISGVDYGDSLWVILVAALVFSVVNVIVKPIVVFLSLPAIILSMGLFMLIINGLMLYLVTVIYPEFIIDSFSAAIVTVIIMWVVNYAFSTLLGKERSSA